MPSKQEAFLDQFLAETEPTESDLDQFLSETAAPSDPSILNSGPVPGVPGLGGQFMAGPGEPAPLANIPAPPPPEDPSFGQKILPNTLNPGEQQASPVYSSDSSGRVDRHVMTQEQSGFDPLADLAGLPTRTLGSATDPVLPGNARGDNPDGSRKSFGQGMANPDAGVMRPAREYLGEVISKRLAGASDEEKAYMQRVGDVLIAELAGAGYIAAAAAEDPTILLPMGATPKVVNAMERMGPGMRQAGGAVAEAPNKLAGRFAQEMSGVREEALRMAGTTEGRQTLQGAAGQQNTVGQELVRLIDQADDAIPERQKVEEALAQMGDMDLQSAVDALEGAKVKPVRGRLLPNEETANRKIDTYIEALRGGPAPVDLGTKAQRAQADLLGVDMRAQEAADLSAQSGREAAEAARATKEARSTVGKSANRIKTLKRNKTDFGWWYDEAREEAKEAARKAREAAENLDASSAASGIRSADADAARSAVKSAESNYAVADAAAQLYAGKSLKEVGQSLIKNHKLRGDDLRQALDKAKKKAANQPKAPDMTVSAPEYRQLRRRLDVNVDFDSEEGALVNEALKTGRFSMKEALIQKARESGNPDYEKWMQTWAGKLDKLEELKAILGSNDRMRKQRAERFIGTLFGKNTTEKRQLVKDLDEIFGSDIMGKAKNSIMAGELGPGGKATWFPTNATGRSTLGFVIAKGLSIPFSSPIIASRVTLPFANKLEKVLKATGGALSNRAQRALQAAMKARSAVVQMRMMDVIEKDVGPDGVAGFRKTAEADRTGTEERRYARR